MRNFRMRPGHYFQLFLLLFAAIIVIQLITISRESQQLRADRAEVNHIKYNLLNVEEWSVQLQTILEKKIDEFEITDQNKQSLNASIQNILYQVIDEVEKLMEKRTEGQFSRIKRWVADMAIDMDQLRDSVPAYSAQIIAELNKPQTRRSIKEVLDSKLKQYVGATNTGLNMNELYRVFELHDSDNRPAANRVISEKLESRINATQLRMYLLITAVLIVFLIAIYSKRDLVFADVILLVTASICLLVSGISLPMIQLEAKIDLVRFELLGEEMSFTNNILYYQSKSILEMVGILIREGSLRMMLVGFLIFMFSLIFPVLKTVGTLVYVSGYSQLRENRIVTFFALRSGKWSMADVLVVAMFMVYIGFNGIVDSQLDDLTQSAEPVKVFTTNGTELLPGFYLFLSFVLSGLALSEITKRMRRPAQEDSTMQGE